MINNVPNIAHNATEIVRRIVNVRYVKNVSLICILDIAK